MTSRTVFLIPLALTAGLTACGTRTEATTMTGPTDQTDADRPRVRAAMAPDTVMMAAIPSAQQFVDLAIMNDTFEIAAARLALTNAAGDSVKAFARRMIATHTAASQRVARAAAAARPVVTPGTRSTPDYDKRLADLRTLRAAAFDRAYIDDQVHEHHAILSLFQLYASGGNVPGLKVIAEQTIPVVQDHLKMAQDLAAR